jgi:hypothetical protein
MRSKADASELLLAIDETLAAAAVLLERIKARKITLMSAFLGPGAPRAAVGSEDDVRWPLAPLKELLERDSVIEGLDDLAPYRDYFSDAGVILLESRCWADLRIRTEECRHLSPEAVETFSQYVVRGGAILFAQGGEHAGTSAIMPLFHEGGLLGAGSLAMSVHPERCESFYLLNVLHFYYRMGVFDDLRETDGVISTGRVMELRIPLPPLEDQKEVTDSLLSLSEGMVAQETYRHSLEKLRTEVAAMAPEK